MRDVMVDIETLGVKPWSVIIAIGAVTFDPYSGEIGSKFYMNVDPISCEEVGLTMDKNIVEWWGHPDRAEAWAQTQVDPFPIQGALKALTAWFEKNGMIPNGRVWGHGSVFDVPILETAYSFCKDRAPWHFTNVRDTRTVFDLAGVDFRSFPKVDTHHNALDDSITQVNAVARAYDILGVKK